MLAICIINVSALMRTHHHSGNMKYFEFIKYFEFEKFQKFEETCVYIERIWENIYFPVPFHNCYLFTTMNILTKCCSQNFVICICNGQSRYAVFDFCIANISNQVHRSWSRRNSSQTKMDQFRDDISLK